MLADTLERVAAPPASSARIQLRNHVHGRGTIRAVLFDLDGTLYTQPRMRALMAVELALHAVRCPLTAPRTIRVLRAYRQAQELMRRLAHVTVDAGAQTRAAAAATGLEPEQVEAIVTQWMFDRPLKYIAGCRAHGIVELLDFLTARGVALGVFSDYPAARKLEALRLADRFTLVLNASEPEIAAFKPNPRGLLRACELWAMDPSEVLFVGDRPEVDGAAAAAVGMPCAIVATGAIPPQPGVVAFSSFARLHRVLDDHCR